MPCYHPLPGWFSKTRNPSGKRSIVFGVEEGFKDKPIQVPCGRCIGCRLERSRQWALRCVHESKLWPNNCFLTLTYDNEHVPADGSLRPRDFVLFMKKLRKRYGEGIRFFQCGEYGEQLGRPHHHCLLFNHDFTDRKLLSVNSQSRLYESRELNALWGHGFASIGDVSFESAGYVARYSLKKVTGPDAEKHYGGRLPEYLTMSRRPGIGRGWLDEFSGDVYPDGVVVTRGGVKCKAPRYYDAYQEEKDPEAMWRLRVRRKLELENDVDGTGSRLIEREAVVTAATELMLARRLEKI